MWEKPKPFNSDKYLPVGHKKNQDTFSCKKTHYFSTTSSSLIFHLQPLMPSLMPRHQYRACTRPIQAPGEGIYISIDAPLSSSSPKIGNILKSMGWFGLNWSCHVCLNLVWSHPAQRKVSISDSLLSDQRLGWLGWDWVGAV